jgi:hypothetical protein
MKTFKREINAIIKSANKILDLCEEMKKPKAPREVLKELTPEEERAKDEMIENEIDQDILEDKNHEEIPVEPIDPTEIPNI